MLWRIFFSVNFFLHLRAQCWFWEGLLRKYQMSCWFMFLSPPFILYNTAFSIINIKAAPDRSGLICLFILFRYDLCCSITYISAFFLHFLNKHKYFPNHTNIGSMSPINVKGLSWFDLVNNKLENTWAP